MTRLNPCHIRRFPACFEPLFLIEIMPPLSLGLGRWIQDPFVAGVGVLAERKLLGTPALWLPGSKTTRQPSAPRP